MTSHQMTDEERANRLLEQLTEDIREVILRDEYQACPHVAISALLTLAGILARSGAQREPGTLPVFLHQADMLRAFIESAAVPERPRQSTMH